MFDNIIEEDLKFILKNVNLKHFKNSNILILGGNSFLATYIQATLDYANKKNLKCNITSLSLNRPKGLFQEICKNSQRIKFIKIDLNNTQILKKILKKKFNFIFHCATYAPPKKWTNNQFSTVNLNTNILKIILDYSLKNKSKLLYFSSSAVYAPNDKSNLIDENHQLSIPQFHNKVIYAASKIIGEYFCKIYKDRGVKVYIVRPGHIYGPGQDIYDQRAISQLIKEAIYEKKIYLLNKNDDIKTWGYLADITIMFLNIIQKGKSLTYNTAGKDFASIYDLAKIISKYFNKKIVIKKNKINNAFINSDYSKSKISSKKYFNEFKKFRFKNLKIGMKRFIDWNIGKTK